MTLNYFKKSNPASAYAYVTGATKAVPDATASIQVTTPLPPSPPPVADAITGNPLTTDASGTLFITIYVSGGCITDSFLPLSNPTTVF